MKRRLLYLWVIVVFTCNFLMVSSCGNISNPERNKNASEAKQKISQLMWLVGQWENRDSVGYFIETWKKISDSALFAESFLIQGIDTVFAENVKLEYKPDGIYYRVNNLNQNQGNEVSFKLISDNDGIFIFENKAHDFPQRIIYQQISPDSLYAKIEGNDNGKFRFEEFPMQKVH